MLTLLVHTTANEIGIAVIIPYFNSGETETQSEQIGSGNHVKDSQTVM